jgi:hypothetical protein
MNYLYLIQKKQDKNTDVFKVGLLKYNNRINKSHDIILLLENIKKCININDLIKLLKDNFKVVDKSNNKYWTGDKSKLIYVISSANQIGNVKNNEIHHPLARFTITQRSPEAHLGASRNRQATVN